jgi:hypothetical protein
MLRTALAALALAVLGGCASLGHSGPVRQPLALLAAPAVENAPVSFALERRGFSPPSERQPEQRRIYATASDSAWRKRHVRRRHVSMLRL